jgi:TRAP-type C4-dicarboxylate transport system permease small subunit
MQLLSSLNKRLNSITTGVVIFFAIAMTVIVGYQVFRRYVMNASLIWSEEAARYLMVWITFLGSSVALSRDGHIKVTIAIDRLPKRSFHLVALGSYAVVSFTLLVITSYGLKLAITNMHQLSPALQMPIGIVYFCLPIGGSLMMLQMVERIWGSVTELRRPMGEGPQDRSSSG